jgi:hypothetical protein
MLLGEVKPLMVRVFAPLHEIEVFQVIGIVHGINSTNATSK